MLLISVNKHFTLIIMIPGLQHTSRGFSSREAYNWSSNGNLVMAATLTLSSHARERNWIVFEEMKYTNKLTFMKNWVFSGYFFFSFECVSRMHSLFPLCQNLLPAWANFPSPSHSFKRFINFACTRWLALLFSKPISYDERKNTEGALETN